MALGGRRCVESAKRAKRSRSNEVSGRAMTWTAQNRRAWRASFVWVSPGACGCAGIAGGACARGIRKGLGEDHCSGATLSDKFSQGHAIGVHEQCAICELRERLLLDAPHIVPDRLPDSVPEVRNGLAMVPPYDCPVRSGQTAHRAAQICDRLWEN